ncbi:MAG: hypothetical protein ACE5F1_07490 [Planctomycetota bacterium]
MSTWIIPVFVAAALAVLPSQEAKLSKPAGKSKAWVSTDAYPLETCPISGKALKKAVRVEAGGRSIKVCCKKCVKKVQKDPEAAIKKLEAAVIAQQSANYPLTTCPISKRKLGSMGKPVDLVLGNHLVKLCCKGCKKKALKSASQVIAKIETAAHAKQSKTYAPKTCPVSGRKLGAMGKPFEVMHGTTLVKLCCKGCLKKFTKTPSAFLAKLNAGKQAPKPAKGR